MRFITEMLQIIMHQQYTGWGKFHGTGIWRIQLPRWDILEPMPPDRERIQFHSAALFTHLIRAEAAAVLSQETTKGEASAQVRTKGLKPIWGHEKGIYKAKVIHLKSATMRKKTGGRSKAICEGQHRCLPQYMPISRPPITPSYNE